MNNVKIHTIGEYTTHTGAERMWLINPIRELIKHTVPEAEERIAWSTPWYYLHTKPFVYIQNNPTYVNLGFAFGAQLTSDLLEGSGKNMRHIKIRSVKEFEKNKAKITHLLQEARNIPL